MRLPTLLWCCALVLLTACHVAAPGAIALRDGARELPPKLPPDAQLVVRAYTPSFELFIGTQRLYSLHGPAEANGRPVVHVIALPPSAAGQHLDFRVPADADEPLFARTMLLVPRASVPVAVRAVTVEPIVDDIPSVLTGIILATFGAFAMIVAGVRRAGARTLFEFGLLALLYGTRVVLDSVTPLSLGMPWRAVDHGVWLISYVINIPAWLLIRRLIGDGWRSTLRIQLWLFVALAVLGIGSDLIRGEAGTQQTLNNTLVVVGGINLALNIYWSRRSWSRDLRIVLVGAAIFGLFALAANLAGLGLLPWRDVNETPGFVLFVGTLGYVAARRFVASERDRLAIDAELATAREIQQSILPSTMPEVDGLRLHACYVPASSVAGDLYDFLPLDARRAGVFVADVSGHGVPAALIASMAKIAVSSQTHLADAPASLLASLNATLRREVRRGFVTATYLFFDLERGVTEVANAGHPPPLLLRDSSFRELGPSNVLLGRFASVTFATETIALAPGDRVAAYTDGLVEARDARGEAFGDERLQAALRRTSALEPRGAADAVLREVQTWRSGGADADDLTLVVIDVVSLPSAR
ncbi:MAG TPA: PP2C family protein-serine/threonine phosphatase [Thermoanaerobaculia bacterium]|jgi:sigma-B regulation protein RsbU (phosphoserine phosphatase)